MEPGVFRHRWLPGSHAVAVLAKLEGGSWSTLPPGPLSGLFSAGHYNLPGADGLDDVELGEHAHGSVDLWRVSRNHGGHGGGSEVDCFSIEMLDDLQRVRALLSVDHEEFNQEHFLHHRICGRVLIAVHHIDKLGHLLHDLLEALRGPLEADRHTAEVRISPLRDDKRLDIVTTSRKDLADSHQHAGLIVYKDRESVGDLIRIDLNGCVSGDDCPRHGSRWGWP